MNTEWLESEFEKCSISRDPRDWLYAFRIICLLASLRRVTYVSLAQNFVMLGVGDTGPLKKPADFDSKVLSYLQEHALVKKVRRVLLEDFQRDEGDLKMICEKTYCLQLLALLN